MDNSDKLIEKIKEQDLKPIPRWQFLMKDSILWTLFIMSTIFGAFAFSIVLYAIQQVDFNLFGHMTHSWYEMLLSLVPLIWIIFLIVSILLIIISIKNSRKGYKFSPLTVLGLGTALSILLGVLFFITGGGKWLDHAFAQKISRYDSVEDRKIEVWSLPEEGTLSGTILSTGENTFELEDFKGKSWIVDFSHADLVPSVEILDGEKIKMTGKMLSENRFQADKIRPWGGFQHRHHGGRKNK